MAEKVIIVGAPRSGTNMLRDVLTAMPGVATWPCDEINMLWRHGNRELPHDEIPVEGARPEVVGYIRHQFGKVADRYDAEVVVEKTCATSLRVDFAHAVLPEAKFIFITRDGIDAAASALARWHAPLDVRYTAAKARYVPPSDLAYYATSFVRRQLQRRRRGAGPVGAWWGPKPRDYQQLMATHPLDELCMIQWTRCVERATASLRSIPEEQVHRISYESFVADPEVSLAEVLEFMGRPSYGVQDVVAGVSSSSVGKGRQTLNLDRLRRLEQLGAPTLAGLGYA